MASGALFIGWGAPVTGREQQANRVFGEAMQFFGRLQQGGEIESFEPLQLEPHGGDLSGCCIVRGDRSKLSGMRFGDEFQQLINKASLVVEHFGVVDAHIGEDMQRGYEQFRKLAEELG
jgi:hypothetical protein